jgi:hypothetical protein
MGHLSHLRFIVVGSLVLAATRTPAVEKAAPPGKDASGTGSCVIVEYKSKTGDPYTWYYCPSSRVFIRPGQRWITNLDTGMETRVMDADRQVRTSAISVQHEQRRTDTGQQGPPSFTTTGRTDVIAGITAKEYLVKVTVSGRPREIRQWFAKDLPTPGRKKAMAAAPDKDKARNNPSGVFLRDDDREATSVRKGEPPASILAIPADYTKQHWSAEKKGWVDGE